MALQLFLLGPGAGVGIGLLGVATLDLIRRRLGIRRDYESLYSLGLCSAAYAAAESLHGSGFLAVFAAGMTISTLDVELCDVISRGEPSAVEVVIPEQITLDELRGLQERGEPVVILDARSRRSIEGSDITAQGAIRLDPDRAVKEAERLQLPREAWQAAGLPVVKREVS